MYIYDICRQTYIMPYKDPLEIKFLEVNVLGSS